MQTDLTLRLPKQDEEEEFLRAHRATSPEVPCFLHYYKEGMPFSRYLELLADQERGVNLPPNHSLDFSFRVLAPRIVGWVFNCHSLNEFLGVWAGTSATLSFQNFVGGATLLTEVVTLEK